MQQFKIGYGHKSAIFWPGTQRGLKLINRGPSDLVMWTVHKKKRDYEEGVYIESKLWYDNVNLIFDTLLFSIRDSHCVVDVMAHSGMLVEESYQCEELKTISTKFPLPQATEAPDDTGLGLLLSRRSRRASVVPETSKPGQPVAAFAEAQQKLIEIDKRIQTKRLTITDSEHNEIKTLLSRGLRRREEAAWVESVYIKYEVFEPRWTAGGGK